MNTSSPMGMPTYAAHTIRRTSTLSALLRSFTACHEVTKALVREADDDRDLRVDRQRHEGHRQQRETESGDDLQECSEEDDSTDNDQLSGGHEQRF
jgi:hypothetical protein